ncbi:YlbD family protein [Bacillus sp. SCS-153A]|uniref:YlbD family protein n=1 Tax=Rossellomorea sedimentorum TaxID=3115294 RepID=UPI003905908F
MAKKLHPKVKEFKEFVQKHPRIASEVKKGTATWQDLFEEWYLLGEEDSRWDDYKQDEDKQEKKESKGFMDQIGGMLKNMDANQMQQHIHSLSQAIGAVQGVLSQFQSSNSTSAPEQNETPQRPRHPFSFRKD